MFLPISTTPVVYHTFALGTVHGGLHSEAGESSAGSHNTFSGDEDTGGASLYHAHYPYWVYASHPSQECQERNTDCPPVDQAQLRKYQQQRQNHSRTVALIVLGAAAVIVIAALAVRYAPAASGRT